MWIQTNVDLTPHNTFGLPALARVLVHIRQEADLDRVLACPEFKPMPKVVLGGGSNMVFSADVPALVLKMEIMGRRLLRETESAWIVEAGAGEQWDALVRWTLDSGFPGLENLALIPGTVGGAPVQNIGAYGMELKDRFDSLDGVDLKTGRRFSLTRAQCGFGYRDSRFKRALCGRCVITQVRLRLPKPWRPVLQYPGLAETCRDRPDTRHEPKRLYETICGLRRSKLPDPRKTGSAGSFFKNPVVSGRRFGALVEKFPDITGHRTPEGAVKLSAGWLIEACGWKGKAMGRAAVWDDQALVLVNQGGATAAEVLGLAGAIQRSVQDRFGIRLQVEPTVY